MLFGIPVDFARWQPRVLGALRIIAALLFLQHGLAKLFGFPTPQPANFALFSLLGAAALIEVVGSVLLVLGLFSREAGFIMSGQMAVAYFYAHAPASFYPLVNRGEGAILFCFIFLLIAFAGPGAFALDNQRAASRPHDRDELKRR